MAGIEVDKNVPDYWAYMMGKASEWKLSHWELTLELVVCVDGEPKQDGECDYSTDYHTCTIRVRKDQDEENIKHTITHELLHLRFEGHLDKQERDPMYEYGLNVISKLLV